MIDEKTKFYPINEYVQFLCHEVLQTNRAGKLQDGWFIDKRSITTHYEVITLFTEDASMTKYNLTKAGIKQLDVLRYGKKTMKSWLAEHGITDELLKAEGMELIKQWRAEGCPKKKLRRALPTSEAWLTLSGKFDECPVNLVVPRQTLAGLQYAKTFKVGKKTA